MNLPPEKLALLVEGVCWFVPEDSVHKDNKIMDSWYESIWSFSDKEISMTSRHFMAGCFFNKPLEGTFSIPNKKTLGPIVLMSNPLGFYMFLPPPQNPSKDYVGALEDLDLALQIEPENPFPQCCRAEADSCSCL